MRFTLLILILLIAAGSSSVLLVQKLRDSGLLAAVAPAHAPVADTDNKTVPFAPSSLPNEAVAVAAGEVDVENGTTPLSPQAVGSVKEVAVKEGDHVAKGQALVRLDSRVAELQVTQSETAVIEAELRLEHAKQTAAEFPHQLIQQEQAIIAAQARLSAQASIVKRLIELRKTGAVSDDNYQVANQKIAEAEADLKVQKEKLIQLRMMDASRAVRLADAALKAANGQCDLAKENLARQTLTAPSAGLVLRIFVNPGQLVGADSKHPAIWFQPDNPMVVRCEIEQEFADRVQPGMKAEIANESGGDARWTGIVDRRANWVAPRRTLLNENAELREVPTVECIVRLDPKMTGLRVGQRVRVLIRNP